MKTSVKVEDSLRALSTINLCLSLTAHGINSHVGGMACALECHSVPKEMI